MGGQRFGDAKPLDVADGKQANEKVLLVWRIRFVGKNA
jgi:hypothetical protein